MGWKVLALLGGGLLLEGKQRQQRRKDQRRVRHQRRAIRSKIDRMRRPETRVVLLSIALVAIGSITGALLQRLSFPRVSRLFNTCASSKQFIVEFRINEPRPYGTRIPGLFGEPLNTWGLTLEVDGARIGELNLYGSLRHFFCEGNHKAHIRYNGHGNETLEHAVDFAVSRPSLFHVTAERVGENSTTCVSEVPCWENVAFELSPYEPDDQRARVYPPER